MTNKEVFQELAAALRVAYYGDHTFRCGLGPLGDNGKTMPHAKFAKLTSEEIDDTWDCSHRHHGHTVAKALVLAESRT